MGSKRFHPDQNLKQQIWWGGMNYSDRNLPVLGPPNFRASFLGWGNPMRENNLAWWSLISFGQINQFWMLDGKNVDFVFVSGLLRTRGTMIRLNYAEPQQNPFAKGATQRISKHKNQCWFLSKKKHVFFKGIFSQCFDLLKNFITNPKHLSMVYLPTFTLSKKIFPTLHGAFGTCGTASMFHQCFLDSSSLKKWIFGGFGPGDLDSWDAVWKGLLLRGIPIRIPNHQFAHISWIPISPVIYIYEYISIYIYILPDPII